MTNYFSTWTQSHVFRRDNKGRRAALIQWTPTLSWTVSKSTPDRRIELTNQIVCELVIQITVCEGYLLLRSLKGIWGTRKLAGRPVRRPRYRRSLPSPVCKSLESRSSRKCRVFLAYKWSSEESEIEQDHGRTGDGSGTESESEWARRRTPH